MTTSAEAREQFHALLNAWNARDLDRFCAQLTPDIQWHDLGMPHPPAIGRDAVRSFSASILRAFPDFTYELRGSLCVAEDGLSCVGPFRLRARFTGYFDPPGFAPTGRQADIDGLDYLQFRDGLVSRIETRFDPLDLAQQLFGLEVRAPAGSWRERLSVRVQRAHAWWLRRAGAVARSAGA